MLKRNLLAGVLAVSSLAVANAASAAVAVNFETAADLTNNFNLFGTSPTLTNGAPVVGTASLAQAANSNVTETYKNATFGLNVGQQLTITMKFAKTGPTSTGSPLLQLGFGTASTDPFNNTSTDRSALYTRILPTAVAGTGTTGTFSIVYDNKVAPTAVGSESTGQSGFAIENVGGNNFFLYTATFQRTATNTFKILGLVQRLDTDFATPVATVASFTSGTLTNAPFATAATDGLLYAGFRTQGSNFGFFRGDDFTVSDASAIPEPASLLAVASVGAAALRRRRR